MIAGGSRCGAEVKMRRADMQPQHGLLPGRESGIGRGKGQHVPHQRHQPGRVVVRTDGEGLVVQTAEELALEPEHAREGRIGGHGHRTGPDHGAAAQGGDGADGGVGSRHRAACRIRLAGERLGMAEVVVEAHPHLEGLAQVGVDQGVGARILARNVGLRAVHPDPLVRVGGAGQPVVIHDAGGDRRQRLAHLGRARDGRRARRRGVGAPGVGDEVGPATAVGGDLNLVAGDGGAAGAGRGGPGEVDLGRPVGGRGQPGGRAGRGRRRRRKVARDKRDAYGGSVSQ